MSRAGSRAAAMASALLTAACGGSGGTAPNAVNPAPSPAPPAVSPMVMASFVETAARVREGETVDITVRYRAEKLTVPLDLELSPARTDDYRLSAAGFRIPAGEESEGSAVLPLWAFRDAQVAEGEEVFALRLLQRPGIRAQLGSSLEVTIVEAGATPCSGIEVLASPVVPIPATSTPWNWNRTTLELRLAQGSPDAWLDWVDPYVRGPPTCKGSNCPLGRSAVLDLSLDAWHIEKLAGATRHSLEVRWHQDEEAVLRFGSYGTCDGEPLLSCRDTGCELTR